MTELRNKERIWFAAAALFAVVAIFTNLGSDGIYAAQEGRTALICRNMLRSGDFFEMQVDYGIPYEKPIGHYWLCLPFAAAAGLGGDAMESAVEWGIRLPSALCALLTVLLAGLLADRMYGRTAACVTMVVLPTMPLFDKLARLGHIDMPLAASFMLAMYFLWVGYAETGRSNRKLYFFYAALGWGALLKGPLVLILAGLVVAGLMAVRGREGFAVLRDLRLFRGAAVFLAAALPWYCYESIRTDGAFFQEFIVNQNLRRFTGVGSTYRDGEFMPVWYYLPKLFAETLPWSGIAVIAAAACRKRFFPPRFSEGTRFLLIWFGTGFVFFSLSALKRGDYLLPIFPPLAILTARGIVEGCRRLPAVPKGWRIGWGVFAGILALAYAVNASGAIVKLGEMIVEDRVPFGAKRDGMSMIMISNFLRERPAAVAAAACAVLALAYAAGKLLEKRRYFPVFGMMAAVVLGAFLAYHLAIEPGTDSLKSVKGFARAARDRIPPGAGVVYRGDFNTEMIYFVDRPYHTGDPRPEDRILIVSPKSAEELACAAPGVWRELLRTPEDHQYPAVLLIRAE